MIKNLLKYCKSIGCSDIHISSNTPITVRVNGEIIFIDKYQPLNPRQVYELIDSITSESQKKSYVENLEIDFALQTEDSLRFRVNAFHTIKGPAIVFREIPLEIKDIADLHIPEIVRKFTTYQNGLVLVVGPTGNGKSTTIASLVNHINKTKKRHIITIEDPVEFVYQNQQSIINQREVGANTKSFPLALRNALREDPDVIVVGEMRDLETIHLALTAAETGHLVFATLHTSSAVHTLNRIIDVFPPKDKTSVRSMLSTSLKAVLSQHLLPGIDGKRYPATELMFVNSSIKNLIREDNIHQINSIIEINKRENMYLMKESVRQLFNKGLISQETAEEGYLY